MFDISTPPVFTEMLLRMIEELSDEIISWSTAGDSFVIKQARKKRQARRHLLMKRKHYSLSRCLLLV